MFKKIYISTISITIFLFFSCKKTDSSDKTTSTTSNSNANSIYGYLIGNKSYDVYRPSDTLIGGINHANAYFFSNPQNSSYTSAGDILVGNIKLKYAGSIYYDTTQSVQTPFTFWNVSGYGSVPSFTYVCNDSMPKYTDYLLLPDTLYKNQNLTVQLNGISGADYAEVIIMDGTSNIQGYVSQLQNSLSANNIITIPSSSFSGFSTFSTTHYAGAISIILSKYTDQTFSGKKFRFITELQVSNNVYIK